MVRRKVSILEPAATAVAEIAWFIESKGMPQTAKKFVDEAFLFLKNFLTRESCTDLVITTDGKHWVTDVRLLKKNI